MLNLHAVVDVNFHDYVIPVPTVYLKWGKWIAMNSDGFVNIFDRKPTLIDGTWQVTKLPGETQPMMAAIAMMDIVEDKVDEWFADSLVEIIFPTLSPERITLNQIYEALNAMKPSRFSCLVAAVTREILEWSDFKILKQETEDGSSYYAFNYIDNAQFEICFFNEINRMIYKLGNYTLLVDIDKRTVIEQFPDTFDNGVVETEYTQAVYNSFGDIVKFSKLLSGFMVQENEHSKGEIFQ
jgi:hypothetical protein